MFAKLQRGVVAASAEVVENDDDLVIEVPAMRMSPEAALAVVRGIYAALLADPMASSFELKRVEVEITRIERIIKAEASRKAAQNGETALAMIAYGD